MNIIQEKSPETSLHSFEHEEPTQEQQEHVRSRSNSETGDTKTKSKQTTFEGSKADSDPELEKTASELTTSEETASEDTTSKDSAHDQTK